MDTIMILHITLLLIVAVASSYSENKTEPIGSTTTAAVATTAKKTTPTSPIKITTSKIIDVKNASEDDSPTAKSNRGPGIRSSSFGNTGSFNKRIDPNFSSSLTSFDDLTSGIISADSVTGFTGVKSDLKGSFDIGEIDIKSDPTFDIDVPIKGSSSFNIEGTDNKDSTPFSIDSLPFSLDGATFSIDGGTFNLDSPTFDVEGVGIKGGPSFSIVNTDFDIDGPTVKDIPSFDLEFQSAKRSPSYTSDPAVKSSNPVYNIEPAGPKSSSYNSENYKSDVNRDYKPESHQKSEASSSRSAFPSSPKYGSIPKKNYSLKTSPDSYITSQSTYPKEHPIATYSLTSPRAAYTDRNQYPGSHATPSSRVYKSYATTPYYENYITPTSSRSISDGPRAISNLKSPYSKPSEISSTKKIQGVSSYGTPVQNPFKNNVFDGQGFGADYAAIQNLNQNSFPQGGSSGSLQFESPQTQIPVYNSLYAKPKNTQQTYAPAHQNAINFSPSTQSFEKLSQNLAYTSNPLEYNHKRATSLPVVQLQSTEGFPQFIQSLVTEPIVLTTIRKNNLQNAPNLGLSFDFGNSNGNQPFLATTNGYQQAQVIPVQSSSSTPQFPQYKGASIKALPKSDYIKPAGSYQPLKSQPQLHFKPNVQAVNRPQEFSMPKTLERIKEDVEIIKNNKKAPLPQNDNSEEEEQDDDDEEDRNDELDEGYKSLEREYGQQSNEDSLESQIEDRENEDGSSENYSEEPEFISNMPPMGPFVFKPYDEKVGRLHEFVRQPEPQNRFSEEASEEDDGEYSTETYSPTKPPTVAYDQKSPKSYFNYASPKPSVTAYDDDEESEEETAKYGKQEDDESTSYEDKGPIPYIRQYDKKSINFYKKKPLNNEYAYVKQVPDIRGSSSDDSTAYPKNSKYLSTKNYSPKPIHNRASYGSAESTERSARQGIKRKTKKPYKNIEEHETVTSFKTDPSVIHEESFGYKIPKKEVFSKHGKGKEGKKKQSSARQAPNQGPYSRYTKENDGVERNSKTPKRGDAASYENSDSYSFSSEKNRKNNRKAPETTNSQSYPTSEARNVQYITDDDYNFFSPERIRPGLSGSIFRDFIDVY